MNYLQLDQLDIPRLLKNEREKRLLTYEDVGTALKCSASYVFRIEKGKRKKPSYEIVGKMINFFELEGEDLLVYLEKMPELHQALQEPEKGQRILKFTRTMDTNSTAQVKKLIEMVDDYQS